MRRFAAALVLALALAPAELSADAFPVPLDPHVTDLADVLTPPQEEQLGIMLGGLRTETGIEAAVVIIPTRRDYDPSASIEAFAKGLFNDWGIGDATRNDGILMLVVTEDREMRLELGSGYHQGYDVLAQDIVSRFVLPEFRAGDFGRGIITGAGEVVARIARRHAALLPPEALPPATGGRGGVPWIPVGLLAAGIGIIAFRRRAGGASPARQKCPSCGRPGLVREVIDLPASDTEPGTRVERINCPYCDHREDRTPPTFGRHGNDADPGGGFGGGKSSGGGATGRW